MGRKTFYCPEIGRNAGVSNAGPIFNKDNFGSWQEYLTNENNWNEPDYDSSKGKEFLEQCKEHRKQFAKPKDTKHVITLVHPLYTWLEEYNTLSKPQLRDLQAYTEELTSLLEAPLDRSRVEIVALETTYHYAAMTSLLLEAGKIDDVIFTENDMGLFLRDEGKKRFHKREALLGGGYLGRCLKSACWEICQTGKIKTLIKDLTLLSPYDGERLCWSTINHFFNKETQVGFQVTEEQITTSQKVIEQFRIGA